MSVVLAPRRDLERTQNTEALRQALAAAAAASAGADEEEGVAAAEGPARMGPQNP